MLKVRADRGSKQGNETSEVSHDCGRAVMECGPLLIFSLFTLIPVLLLSFVPYISCPSLGNSTPVEPVHVLGLLHEELHGPGPVGALSSLAQAEVTLSGAMGQASAHILYRRPRQRPTHQVRRSMR